MISLTKKSVLDSSSRRASASSFASAASDAHAAGYQIAVYEDTFGPAAGIPYQNGIIQKYITNPDALSNIPNSAGFQYTLRR